MAETKQYIMLSRDGKRKGVVTNMQSRKCTTEGCAGWRMNVRWEDGRRTMPCSKGCKCIGEGILQII